MIVRLFFTALLFFVAAFSWNAESGKAASPSTILVILADDLGYGDVQCNKPPN